MDWLSPDNASAAFLRNGLSFLSDNGLNSMMDMVTVKPSGFNKFKNGTIDFFVGKFNTASYMVSSVVAPISNQIAVTYNEGFHQGKANDPNSNWEYAKIYKIDLTTLKINGKHIAEPGSFDVKEAVYHTVDASTNLIPGVQGAHPISNLIMKETAAIIVNETSSQLLNYHE